MYSIHKTGFEVFIKILLKADTCFLSIPRVFRDWLVLDEAVSQSVFFNVAVCIFIDIPL